MPRKIDIETSDGGLEFGPGAGFEGELTLDRARDRRREQRLLLRPGSALIAAKAAASSSSFIQSRERPERSAIMASPGLQAAKSSSFTRAGGLSAVSLTAISRELV